MLSPRMTSFSLTASNSPENRHHPYDRSAITLDPATCGAPRPALAFAAALSGACTPGFAAIFAGIPARSFSDLPLCSVLSTPCPRAWPLRAVPVSRCALALIRAGRVSKPRQTA